MEVAVITKVRNGPLVRHRRSTGRSQKATALVVGVSTDMWRAVEMMRFKERPAVAAARVIASFLNIPLEEVCPRKLVGKEIWLDRVIFRHVAADRILATEYQERMTLPSPEAVLEETEEQVKRLITEAKLSDRETIIIKGRFGIGTGNKTFLELGRELGVTRERVRQLLANALHKMRFPNPQGPGKQNGEAARG